MYTDLERYREMYIEIERAIGRYRDRKTQRAIQILKEMSFSQSPYIMSITLHYVNGMCLSSQGSVWYHLLHDNSTLFYQPGWAVSLVF